MHHKVSNVGISVLKQNVLPMLLSRQFTNVFRCIRHNSSNTPKNRSYGQFPPRKPFLPRNIDYALDIIDQSQIPETVQQTLRKAYYRTERKYMSLKKKHRRKNYPLIVLEGLDGCGKSVVGKRVARKIDAEYRASPSKVLSRIRSNFEDTPLAVRCAFYTIGNHIVSMELFPMISKRTIILDRFWHSTSAFAIAQASFTDTFFPMPERGDPIFVWPQDLIRPDLIMFLHVDERNRTLRHCSRGTSNTNQEQLLANSDKFRNLVLTAYDRMRSPSIVKIDANPKLEDVVDAVQTKVDKVVEKFSRKKKKIYHDDDD